MNTPRSNYILRHSRELPGRLQTPTQERLLGKYIDTVGVTPQEEEELTKHCQPKGTSPFLVLSHRWLFLSACRSFAPWSTGPRGALARGRVVWSGHPVLG